MKARSVVERGGGRKKKHAMYVTPNLSYYWGRGKSRARITDRMEKRREKMVHENISVGCTK